MKSSSQHRFNRIANHRCSLFSAEPFLSGREFLQLRELYWRNWSELMLQQRLLGHGVALFRCFFVHPIGNRLNE